MCFGKCASHMYIYRIPKTNQPKDNGKRRTSHPKSEQAYVITVLKGDYLRQNANKLAISAMKKSDFEDLLG